MHGEQVQSLVGKLRSHVLCSETGKKKKKELLQGDLLQTKYNHVIPLQETLSAFLSYLGHSYKFLHTLLTYFSASSQAAIPHHCAAAALTVSILKQPRFSSPISESSAMLFPSLRISVL